MAWSWTPASKTVRLQISTVLSNPVCGALLWHPQERRHWPPNSIAQTNISTEPTDSTGQRTLSGFLAYLSNASLEKSLEERNALRVGWIVVTCTQRLCPPHGLLKEQWDMLLIDHESTRQIPCAVELVSFLSSPNFSSFISLSTSCVIAFHRIWPFFCLYSVCVKEPDGDHFPLHRLENPGN